jgi:hypothetical protein
MSNLSIYWRTPGGALVERMSGPDAAGRMTVLRLDDDRMVGYNVRDLTPVSDAEALAEARASLGDA